MVMARSLKIATNRTNNRSPLEKKQESVARYKLLTVNEGEQKIDHPIRSCSGTRYVALKK